MSKELDETVLNLQQRMKRAQSIRRNERKLERSREIAKAKLAPDKNIQKRAYSQARQIVRRKVAGQRGAEYETLGPTEKMAIDRLVDRRQKLIKKIALRLMPKVKQAEQARLQAFMKGKALKNAGQPEGNVKMNEELNSKFASKFNKPKVDHKGKKRSPIIQYLKFDEEAESESAVYRAIAKKSAKSGISEEILGVVYDRGMESWVEETGVSQQQYAFARVNSFINKGRTYFNEDADLHEGFKNWTFEMQPGDRTKVIHGDHKGLRGVVVKKHDNGASYSIKDKDGNVSRHHISTLTEPVTEAAVVADGEPITPPPPSPGSKVRKKLEMVDRKTPNGELTKQTEYMRKVIESTEPKVLDESFQMAFDYQGKPTMAPTAHELMMKARGGFAHHTDVQNVMEVTDIKNRIQKAFESTILEEDKEQLDISIDELVDMVNEAYTTIASIKSANVERDAWSEAQILKLERYIESVAAYINNVSEDVKVADKAPVVVPAHNDAHGNLIPAMTVMRKKQKRIIHSGNVHDGEGN